MLLEKSKKNARLILSNDISDTLLENSTEKQEPVILENWEEVFTSSMISWAIKKRTVKQIHRP